MKNTDLVTQVNLGENHEQWLKILRKWWLVP